jgi:hypothetical protein
MAVQATSPFIWGQGGEALTPQQVEARRKLAEAARGRMGDTSPVGHWTQGAARVVDALGGVLNERRADRAETAGMSSADDYIQNNPVLASLIGSGGSGVSMGVPSGAVSAPSMGAADLEMRGPGPDLSGIGASGLERRERSPDMSGVDLASGIIQTAEAIGADPLDLATAISYETAGTFDPTKAGPTTQWGQHRGLIQFGEPQAEQYGVDFSNPDAALASQLGPDGAIAKYFTGSGFRPGMSGLDLYSTINAGAPGRYNASDANNGGAPGSVADKWNNQMSDHRAKAAQLLGGSYTPSKGGTQPQNNAGVIQALTGAMSDPWVAKKYGPVLEALMGQQMKRGDMQYQQQLQQSDPMYQAQLAKLTAPAEVDPWAGTQVINGQVVRMTPNGPEAIGNFNTPDPGYQMVSPEEVAQLGLPEGAYQRGADGRISKIGGGGVTVNNDLGGPELGKLSTDYGYIMDPATGQPVIDPATGLPKAAPVPGSPAAQGIAEAAATDARADSNRNTSTSVITSAASRAREAAEQRVVGGLMGAAAAYNPGSQNAEVYRQNEVLKSNAKVENLNAMRAASKTGGALGSVTEKEAQMLADKSGALDPASPNYLRDLDDYERTLLQVVHGYEAGNEIFQATRGGGQDAPDFSSDTPPAGLDESDADLWPYATPEERQAIWGQ